jgi:hypothetical protein
MTGLGGWTRPGGVAVRGEAGVTEKPISRKQDRTQPHIDAIKPRLSGMDNGSECEKPTLAG